MPQLNAEETRIRGAAKTLWNYLKLDDELQKSDVIIAMGSHDLRVAEHAAQLLIFDWAPLMVCSGGLGRLTEDIWQKPEAEKFAETAVRAGAPKDRILIENRSSNTGENIRFSRNLLEIKGISVKSAILVHKPYMERRAVAAAENYWPEVSFTASSPPIPFNAYPTEAVPMDDVIQIMVGDFQRIMVYPQKGFQTSQPIPNHILDAYQILLDAGFTNHLTPVEDS